uniref:Fibrinogen C-terminal domain-containing protein n=1 Tax=Callorhinchus milii TaxID=7868 RepID=A0A4W3K102_CALMI|eukprot:gi/632947624/ref/XP_007889140.1/ PREDICTED: angiopoietin-related protein 5 [Callorhinchus milii]
MSQMHPVLLLLSIALFLCPCIHLVCSEKQVLVGTNLPVEGCRDGECRVKGTDCTHINKIFPDAPSGIYMIQPMGSPFKVFCDMQDDGGWTVIQSRNGLDSLNFDKLWIDYKEGFGHQSCEHWLGLEKIYALTNQTNKKFKLRVFLKDFEDGNALAEYSEFWIGSEREFYRLHLGNYSGNAGDAFRGIEPFEDDQDGCMFSTYDKDNDRCSPCIFGDLAIESCSDMFGGGWWFNQCGMADLNGDWHSKDNHIGWQSGVHWKTWKKLPYSLQASRLKIRSL